MHREIKTVSDVFEALGGIQAVADIVGAKYKSAHAWKSFPTFPSKHYVAMSHALARKGLSAPPSLWGMTEPSEESERVAS